KAPEKASGWLAYQKEREQAAVKPASAPTQKTVDSLRRTIDSLVLLVTAIRNQQAGSRDGLDADDEPPGASAGNEGSDLVLRNLTGGKEKIFRNVVDYQFSENGQKLAMRLARSPRDNQSANAVAVYDLQKGKLDTVLKGGNDFRSITLSRDGSRLAFLAERDTNARAIQRFYGLYLYRSGDDSASLLIDRYSEGMLVGQSVSENSTLSFSKSGNRLFFGTAPIQPAKDTSLIDIDLVKLDIWHYKDDYLQTQQLSQLANELKRNYMAVYDFKAMKMLQLGSKGLPTVTLTNEGDGNYFLAITDTGRRVEAQWSGTTKKDIYQLNLETGEQKLVKKNHDGQAYTSSTGKYILLYDNKSRHYLAWDGKGLRNITAGIKQPLYNEEHDTPSDPPPYGIMRWIENDEAVYIYDRYDIWRVDPRGLKPPVNITLGRGRKTRTAYRYMQIDPEERFLREGQPFLVRTLNAQNKQSGLFSFDPVKGAASAFVAEGPHSLGLPLKAKRASHLVYTKESYQASPDLYLLKNPGSAGQQAELRLSAINPQQQDYNWGSAELFRWTAFNGKPATGILYKPEGFDSTKSYPMLIYFYEKLSDGLHNYIAPSPTPSRLNVSFFVSRGYVVFAPDISYTKGHPGKDAYNYIVSGAQALARKNWVDEKNIGIQGQSWGGYQVAYLITATNMFKAAWAGAPVVNMFSAYGGIRWESGNNRQSQYEKGQSRIGATPWDKPELYIENSPFFHLKKINTPLVIMANDADGAVPWYQGIEFFTAMRRLNKKVWLLNYNGEAHNLVERKNRKDIQVREQEYFDWLLKGEKPARWLTDGVPAVKKGRDWGLELVD
ncbi:MAG TPA: prolyl oligopeptidase family serine peptidase, partial [Flavisolibacter sp.]|nr:prolyl oligopeptidase family serine peptidase [Flavisolibacter sp.]